MSTTVTYKGETLTTVTNGTKVLLTSGKYMEDDVTIISTEQNMLPITIAPMSYNLSSLGLTWITSAEENI